jgi:hypothetical protein
MTPPDKGMRLRFDARLAVSRAYASLVVNFRPFAVFLFVWTVLSVILIAGLPRLFRIAAEAAGGIAIDAPTSEALAEALALIAAEICLAVSWQRHIILSEPAGRPFPAPIAIVARYTGYLILLTVVPFHLAVVVASMYLFPDILDGKPGLGFDALVFGADTVTLAVIVRFILVLPAVAIGDRTTTLAGSWRLTRGQALALFLGAVACDLPFTIASSAMNEATADVEDGNLAYYPALWAVTAIDSMSIAVSTAFLAFAYLHFVPPNDATRAPATYFE